jgi:hypothetical protein
MPTNEERLKIMKMVQNGKITAEDAITLLDAVDPVKKSPSENFSQPKSSGPGRWFRVKVTDTITGKMRANIRLPISLVSAGLKMGAKFSPEMDGMDINLLQDAIRNNQSGLIIDVNANEDGEHVEIYIEE